MAANCALRNRIKQIAARPQNAEETGETLAAADVLPTVFELSPSQNVSTFERRPFRSDLSREANITGIIESSINFELELKGAGAGTGFTASGGRTLTFANSGSTLTASSGSFVSDGIKVGDFVRVQGTTSNDGYYLISALTATVLTLLGSLTDEGPLSSAASIYVLPMPNYSKVLLGCGIRTVKCCELTVTSTTGLVVGDTLTDGDGDTYKVVITPRSATKIIARRLTGLADGLPSSGAVTGPNAYSDTITAVNEDYSWAYLPHSVTTQILPLGTLAQAFIPGERVTGGTSGAVGEVVYHANANSKNLWYIPISGTFQSGETITGSVSGGSAPSTAVPSCAQPTPPLTIYINEDGVQEIQNGMRGRVNFNYNAVGEPVRMSFEFQGPGATNPTDTAAFAEQTDSIIPPKFQGATIQIGNPLSSPFVPVMASMNIQVDNTIQSRRDATASAGVISALIVDRDFSGQMDPEFVKVAVYTFHANLYADVLSRFYVRIGSTAGNICELVAEKMQFTSLNKANRDDILTLDASVRLVRTVSDDEMQLIVR